jgi:hypothetical protein
MGNKAKTIRNLVALADLLTLDLQVPIQFYAWIGDDTTYGTPVYDDPITMNALVEMKQRVFRDVNGHEIVQRAQITILRPIAPNGAANRREPIDLRDKIVLSSGYTGPIKAVEGLETTLANSPYFAEVTLG